MPELYRVDSPINREQRENLNLTFDDILRRFNDLRRRLDMIANGDFDELLNDINNAIETAIQAGVDTDEALDRVAEKLDEMQNLIDLAATYDHKGEFSVVVQYEKNNAITYNGSTYRAKMDVLGYAPPSTLEGSNDYWQLIARRGVDTPSSELVGIWRGPTPPDNQRLLWWKDTTIEVGYTTYIYVSPTPPPSSDYLWLKKGAV